MIELLVKLIIIFIIPALLQEIYVFSFIPKIIGALVLLIIIILILRRKTVEKIWMVFILLFIFIFSILNSKNLQLNIKDFIYFSTFILISIIIRDKKYFEMIGIYLKKRWIDKVIYIANFIIIISLFFEKSYYSNWGENEKYFKGFTNMPHVMASISIYLLILILFIQIRDKKHGISIYIPAGVSVLLTGSRTFLLPLAIIVIIILKRRLGTKKMICLVFVSVPIIFILFKESPMYQKFEFVINFDNTRGFIANFTSGRSEVWNSCLNYFIEDYNLINKIIGTSFDQVYKIINFYTGMEIWAHNDMINTIVSSGILGIIVYIGAIRNFILSLNNKTNVILFISIYGFISITNGLFILIPSVFSIIIFIHICKENANENSIN